MEKEDLVRHLLRENRIDIKEVKEELSDMKTDVALNRQDLEIHMEQTRSVKDLTVTIKNELVTLITAVEDRHDDSIKRIEHKLSEGYLLKLIVTVASGVGAFSGAIYGAFRLYDSIS